MSDSGYKHLDHNDPNYKRLIDVENEMHRHWPAHKKYMELDTERTNLYKVIKRVSIPEARIENKDVVKRDKDRNKDLFAALSVEKQQELLQKILGKGVK